MEFIQKFQGTAAPRGTRLRPRGLQATRSAAGE